MSQPRQTDESRLGKVSSGVEASDDTERGDDLGTDFSQELHARIVDAHASSTPLEIRGGGSKRFLGRPHGDVLATSGHRGIVAYEPSELVITTRTGTPLADLVAILAQNGQSLGFEPPLFGRRATVGGAIASGLSGPSRPWTGAVRDFMLGIRCISGDGKVMNFGGRVIKNVAGYDISRLMAGAMGTLGVLTEVSLKVLPLPQCERGVVMSMDWFAAHAWLLAAGRQARPLSAATWQDGKLRLRFSGAESAVQAACTALPHRFAEEDTRYWQQLREFRLPFFRNGACVWRIAVPQATPWLDLPGEQLVDWGGAQRYLLSDAPAAQIRTAVVAAGGHATRFGDSARIGDDVMSGDVRDVSDDVTSDAATDVVRRDAINTDHTFSPLSPGLLALHKRLKQVFDPRGILNRGRLYADF